MPNSQSNTPIFLLDPPRPATYGAKLFGSVVRNPFKPTDKFAPSRRTDPTPVHIIPGIFAGTPDVLYDYAKVQNRTNNLETQIKIDRICDVYFQSGQYAGESREGTTAWWYYMERPEDQLKELVQNRQYEKAVVDLISEGGNLSKPFYFASSILILARMNMSRRTESSRSMAAHLEIPDPNNPGQGTILQARASRDGTASSSTQGKYRDEMIVAMGYHAVYLHDDKGLLAKIKKFFGRRPLVIGRIENLDSDQIRELTMSHHQQPGNALFFMGKDIDHNDSQRTSSGSGGSTSVASGSLDNSLDSGSRQQRLSAPDFTIYSAIS